MQPERAGRGGWEAAVDPSLAARLLRPAVRPGISDPAHGPMIVARLRRMVAPSLAEEVARRYGSTVLDAGRIPVVYAVPSAWSASLSSSGESPGGPAGTGRPVTATGETHVQWRIVRATEHVAGPAFPPVRALSGGSAVQRMADPAAATLPIVGARRSAAEVRGGGAGPQAGAGRTGPPVSIPPVVAPAPTRLQRQLAAEHAESAPAAASAGPRVQLMRASPAAGREGDARAEIAQRAPAAAASLSTSVGSSRSMGIVQRAAGPGASAPSAGWSGPMEIVQRAAGPDASPPPRVVSGSTPDPEGMPAARPVVAAGPAGGAETPGAAVSIQRMPLPVTSTTAHAHGGTDGGAVQAIRGRPAEPWSPGGGGGGGGGGDGVRSFINPPVVAARGGSAAVQRMPLAGGSSPASVLSVPRLVHAAPVQRQTDATPTPPAGVEATLPTAIAPGARGSGGGASAAGMAEEVYQMLVRRLNDERKQRGW